MFNVMRLFALVLAVTGTGCGAVTVATDTQLPRSGIVSDSARVPTHLVPGPYVEVVPPAPAVEYVYVNGSYRWNGTENVWVPGYYVPRTTRYVWVPAGWTRDRRGVRYETGHWIAAPGRINERYVR
jgi:hypothetical protein